jgi:DNA polymerase sigma
MLESKSPKKKNIYLEGDILVNKTLELHNGNMLKTYCDYDIRYQHICMILKYWNKSVFPDKYNRLNSYSIALMTLVYMQHLGALPKLQHIESKSTV